MENKYVPLGKRITWEGYKTPINDANLNNIESRIQHISDYLESIQESGMIIGKGVIIGDEKGIGTDTFLNIQDGPISIAHFTSSDITLFDNTETTPYVPLLHIHRDDTANNSFITFCGKTLSTAATKGLGDNSIVINEGDAKGANSIAGGTTNIDLIKSVLGSGYATLISLLGSNVSEWSDATIRAILEAVDTDYTVAEFRQMVSLFPSSAEGMLAISFGASNKSKSTAGISLGYGNISGAKGYYMSSLNTSDRTISLSSKQDSNTSPTRTASDWSEGDRVYIVNGDRYWAEVERVMDGGRTVVLKDIPFTSLVSLKKYLTVNLTNPAERSIVNIDKPENGEVEFGWGAIGIGVLNTILGNNALGVGYKHLIAGDFGASFGQENTVGYSALSSGIGNKSLGKATFTSGEGNEASEVAATALGKDTKARKKYSTTIGRKSETKDNAEAAFVGGNSSVASHYGAILHGNWLTSSRAYQAVFGEYNLDNSKALLIVGNGDAEERSNALEVRNDGTLAIKSIDGVRKFLGGNGCEANKNDSITLGYYCKNWGGASLLGGNDSCNDYYGTIQWGRRLSSSRDYQAVFGENNKNNSNALLIVGNGEDGNGESSNACEVLKDGTVVVNKIKSGEDCEVSGEHSLAGGYKCKSKHKYTITYGSDLSTSRNFQAVFGYDNMDNPDAFLIVGRGEYTKGNAFEVIYKNGASSIKVGNTEITEAQLSSLLALI